MFFPFRYDLIPPLHCLRDVTSQLNALLDWRCLILPVDVSVELGELGEGDKDPIPAASKVRVIDPGSNDDLLRNSETRMRTSQERKVIDQDFSDNST